MTHTGPAFASRDDGGDLLSRDDRQRFQQIFADQAVRAYLFLSAGMGLLALLLPFALVIAGGYDGHYSISFFYHVSDLTRNILVGVLWATGVFLFLFQGLSRWENWILNLGGMAAISVAMNPMPTGQCDEGSAFTLHAASAIVFFACLAAVAIFFSKKRVRHIKDPRKRMLFIQAYNLAGTLMVLMPAVVAFLHFSQNRGCETHWIFWVETFGIAAFAFYWFVKTLEYKLLLQIK